LRDKFHSISDLKAVFMQYIYLFVC